MSSKGYASLPKDLAKALAKKYRAVVKRLDISQNQLQVAPRYEATSFVVVVNLVAIIVIACAWLVYLPAHNISVV
jgi:hypothetical protein